MYPTPKQRAVLQQWFGSVRKTYNTCVDAVEKLKLPKNLKSLRAHCINAGSPGLLMYPWLAKTPYDMRDEGMRDLLKAYDTAFTLLRTGKQKHFNMRHRSSKAQSQSIVIHSKYWKDTKKIFWASAFEKAKAETTLRTREPLPDSINYDCRLQRTRLGHYYVCLLLSAIPTTPSVQGSDNQAPLVNNMPRILAIDPGVRTFATGYDPVAASYVEWGKGDMKNLERLCIHLDDLASRTAKEKNARRRYKMRRAQMRMRLRLKHRVDEFHKKLVAWLVGNYDVILLPSFESSSMVNHVDRRISRPTVRTLLTWSFYRFKQRLICKAKLEGEHCLVQIVDEHYTTMTCGSCGRLNSNVGAAKVFQCPHCAITLPRDWNAARNIFLRYITTSTWWQSLPGLSLGSSGPVKGRVQ